MSEDSNRDLHPGHLLAPTSSTDPSPTLAERLRDARMSAFLRGPADPPSAPGISPHGRSSADSTASGPDQPVESIGHDQIDLDRLVVLTGQLYAAALTDQTRVSYARRWHEFTGWCEDNQLRSLPAAPETLMMYLAEGASLGYSVTTLRGRAAAINRIHLEAGENAPGSNPSTQLFWRGLARTLPAPRALEMTALRIAGLREICRVIDANAVDAVEIRDRAILGLFSLGMTGPEIGRLLWFQVDVMKSQATVTVLSVRAGASRRLKAEATDSLAACPVAALAAWRDHVMSRRGTCVGPVFWHFDPRCEQGLPLTGKVVNEVLRQRRKTLGDGRAPVSLHRAMEMLGGGHPIDLRDKAMLTLGFAGAMRRGEVTELRWSDLRLTQDGLVCRLRRSKTDMEGRRHTVVGIPYGRSPLTCPVTAVLAWRERVEAQFGPVDPEGSIFTTAGRRGAAKAIGREAITRETLTRVVVARARQAGLEGHWGGRSLRAGFISTAADLDIPLEAIATQSRHKTLDTLAVYIRQTDPFRRNPASRVGL